MIETKREKYIRFILIASCMLVVAIGVIYSAPSRGVDDDEKPLASAQILKKQDGDQNAVAAVTKMVGDQQVLVLYDIEKENKFHFNVLHTAAMKEHIEEMKIHGDGDGLWVKTKKEDWILFSDGLDVLTQAEQPEHGHSTRQSFRYEKNDHRAIVAIDQQEVALQLSKETKPLEIHPLSADDSLWLIVYEDELVLAKSN
ncbi:hypothetical protein [Bacillus sp. Marseille-Q1617]|uniref:hypothetical protein n=1 Tax=Bacillus sp. Marseille-Q1617 TaxID=2736887 RepID=UPI00158DBD55|nr:hypothetical protein [Bacillus sp. Marseille-Q1617]